MGLDATTLWHLVLQGLVIAAVCIVVRFLWVFPATYLPRWLSSSIAAQEPSPSWRSIFLVAFTGVRGVVSVAAVLSVPVALAPGIGFPHRDQLLVLTFMVVVVTLIAQGLTLPFVVRKLGLDALGAAEQRERTRREVSARLETALAALERLEKIGQEEGLAEDALQPQRARVEQRIAQLRGAKDPGGEGYAASKALHRVDLALVQAERDRLNELLREGRITDDIRRRIERDLDLDEERLRRNVHGIASGEDEPDWMPERR
jgi:CPA1 family monovalent cation:H+ antiporter